MKTFLAGIFLLLALAGRVGAAGAPKAEAGALAHPSYVSVADVPGLPRVLLIGDSISMGYTLEVRAKLAGIANVHRPAANCNSTGFGLKQLAAWLGDGRWDVVHFNFGLHDAKLPPEGKYHSPLEVYERNLEELVGRLKATGATLVWATSTPIPLGGVLAPDRRFGSIDLYNQVARKVMLKNGVRISDLNSAVAADLPRLQIKGDVHFTPAGYSVLADKTATILKEVLRQKSSP